MNKKVSKYNNNIDKVIHDYLQTKKAVDRDNFEFFVKGLFSYVDDSDLEDYRYEEAKGIVATAYRYVKEKPSNQSFIFNPTVEKNGWQSQHTVIIIHHSDLRYLIDSIRNRLNNKTIAIHKIFHAYYSVSRNKAKKIDFIYEKGSQPDAEKDLSGEVFVYIEIDKFNDSQQLIDLKNDLDKTIADVQIVADDYRSMVEVVDTNANKIDEGLNKKSKPFLREMVNFSRWLNFSHFTYLAYEFYKIDADKPILDTSSRLGLFSSGDYEEEFLQLFNNKEWLKILKTSGLVFYKSSLLSTVHRLAYLDYILIGEFDEKQNLSGVHRVMGLYKHRVYLDSASDIPFVRKKIDSILQASKIPEGTYNYYELSHILQTFPRDELFQDTEEHLLKVCLSVLYLQERRLVKLFIRENIDQHFISIIVYAPRDNLNENFREKLYRLFSTYINIESFTSSTWFSESSLARCRFVFKLSEPLKNPLDEAYLENEVIALASDWEECLLLSLKEAFGEEEGIAKHKEYSQAFSPAYSQENSPGIAVSDIKKIDQFIDRAENNLLLNFYRSMSAEGDELKIKIYHKGEQLSLSDMVPIIENFGLKIIEEYPHEIDRQGDICWIYNFTVEYKSNPDLDPDDYAEKLSEAFSAVWHKLADNDGFNKLILKAGLDWRQISVLRAYARYMKQVNIGLSQKFIATCLIDNTDIVKKLIALFDCRFNPDKKRAEKTEARIISQIEALFDAVLSLVVDKVLRFYLDLISATLRTNFYIRNEEDNQFRSYLSFKINSQRIEGIPLPKPKFEMFVYSPRVEGVHLRSAKVARGGLRWSDRSEDYRTEILGLVKAQQVKNAVIVPAGAKGGFIAKLTSKRQSRDEFLAEGIECYRTFIRGLLDVSDNLIENNISPPAKVVRHDEDDNYLVVAADKGTAAFSDIANAIADEYGFWLGDAFASGGSNGYDHKKMGITARGAWVSVQRHFREQGVNIQKQAFTVIGIGDMSGDVFGNGMLLSPYIRLVSAFNHQHIFIDPNPDAQTSYRERQRLFNLPRSSWSDYDHSLLSKGGKIYSRDAKFVDLSPEIQDYLGTDKQRVAPAELISLILCAEVDLLWNGGIGTYVKAETESHNDVGDKSNDAIRINANQLRCKVVGEGGNLGLTQMARIEYGLLGGAIYTDFIDNAGGVDCSDHEVNIKILLDKEVNAGNLTLKQRNRQLENMTDDVADLVLKNNYRQTQAIALAHSESVRRLDEYAGVIRYLEEREKLNRKLESLPTEEQINARKNQQQGFTRPELSVILSYVKSDLKESLLNSDLFANKELDHYIFSAFPDVLKHAFTDAMLEHPLRKEIAANQLANDIVNRLGLSFISRLRQSTGADYEDIAKMYIAIMAIFNVDRIWSLIEDLDYKIESQFQYQLMLKIARLVRRGVRWLIKNHRSALTISEIVERYGQPIQDSHTKLPLLIPAPVKEEWQLTQTNLKAGGVPEDLAMELASYDYLYDFLGLVSISQTLNQKLDVVANAFFTLAEKLELDDMVQHLESKMPTNNHWQFLSRESVRDDLELQRLHITQNMLRTVQLRENGDLAQSAEVIDEWLDIYAASIKRWRYMVEEIKHYSGLDASIFNVAIRELADLRYATQGESVN